MLRHSAGEKDYSISWKDLCRIETLARPSAASLNSLAEVLRQAQPLYVECRSILNYLDQSDGLLILSPLEDSTSGPDCIPASKDAASISHSVFEHRRYGKGII